MKLLPICASNGRKKIIHFNKDMEGWVKIYRKIMDNPLYFSEPFTRMQAWIDLIILANHEEKFFFIRGNKIEVKCGQIGMSVRTLSTRWRWSRSKTERFLSYLQTEHQIEPQKNNVTTLISISNYQQYQKGEPQNEPQTSHRRATDEPKQECNNVKNIESITKVIPKKKIFQAPTIEEIQTYIQEKSFSKVDAEKFFYHYEANGWYVGKNHMKDWKAAIRYWQSTAKNDNAMILTDNSPDKFKNEKPW